MESKVLRSILAAYVHTHNASHEHPKEVHITSIYYAGKIQVFSYTILKCATEKLTDSSTHYRHMQEYEKDVFKLNIAKRISHTKDHNISPKCV